MSATCGAGWTASAGWMTKICGEAAWQEPHPQSNAWCAAFGATIAEAADSEPDGPALVDPPISDAQDMPVVWPMSVSSSGSYDEQPRHQTVINPITIRVNREAALGRHIMAPQG